MAQSKEVQDNIRRAKDLWDKKQDAKFAKVREQQARTAARTPEQIEIQKIRKAEQKAKRLKGK